MNFFDVLALLFGLAVLVFGVGYNGWLEKNYGCLAFVLWRVALGVLNCILWFWVFHADGIWAGAGLALLAIIASGILLYANMNSAGSLWQGILMTLWQTLLGGLIIFIFNWFLAERERKN